MQFVSKVPKRTIIPFEVINNLMVISLRINDSKPLNFIVDSGVKRTLISSLPKDEKITLYQVERVALRGLGGSDPIYGFRSPENTMRLSKRLAFKSEVVVLEKDLLHLSELMGTQVHGLIGFDLFSRFMVELDYSRRQLVLYPAGYPKKLKRLQRSRRWESLSLEVSGDKAFVRASYRHARSGKPDSLRLLLDTGSSGALTLYAKKEGFFPLPKEHLSGFLGTGLGGPVYGEIGKVADMQLGPFFMQEPVVAYPDSGFAHAVLTLDGRNGSLGADVLRRFKSVVDYQSGTLLLRKHRQRFSEEFQYNRSGIQISTPFEGVPVYEISSIRQDSPAAATEAKKGDQIKFIHGESTLDMSLEMLLNYFKKGKNGRIDLQLWRDSTLHRVQFELGEELVPDS